MGAAKGSRWKLVLIGGCLIILIPGALVVQSLFLVRTTLIEYREPPEIHFAQVRGMPDSDPAGDDATIETSSAESSPEQIEVEDADVKFMFEDLVRDRDYSRLMKLLIHQDQEVRLAVAQAFADSFIGYFEDLDTFERYDLFRREFWEAVNFESEETKLLIKEMFYEALIEQVKAGERPKQLNVVMNLWVHLDPPLGETQTPDQEAYEVLAWIADVHPDPMQRYYAAHWFRNTPDEFSDMRRAGLNARRHDPSFEVRFYTFMDDLDARYEPIMYRLKSAFSSPREAEVRAEN